MVIAGRLQKDNKISYETAYFICTGTLNIDTAMDATRRHWHTENTQHWVLDMTFKEDEQRMYAGDSAKNMACFRRFVMNLLRSHSDPKKRSLLRKINCANHLDDYRHNVLFTS